MNSLLGDTPHPGGLRQRPHGQPHSTTGRARQHLTTCAPKALAMAILQFPEQSPEEQVSAAWAPSPSSASSTERSPASQDDRARHRQVNGLPPGWTRSGAFMRWLASVPQCLERIRSGSRGLVVICTNNEGLTGSLRI